LQKPQRNAEAFVFLQIFLHLKSFILEKYTLSL